MATCEQNIINLSTCNDFTLINNGDGTYTFTDADGVQTTFSADSLTTASFDDVTRALTLTMDSGVIHSVIISCCTDPVETITDANLATASSPITSDISTYIIANGPFGVNTQIVYIGSGTVSDPDYTWLVNEDQTSTNIESPSYPNPVETITDVDLVTAGNPITSDLAAYIIANGPFEVNTQIVYIGSGTVNDPDYVWLVNEDQTPTNIEAVGGSAPDPVQVLVDADLVVAGLPTGIDANNYAVANGPFEPNTLITYIGNGSMLDPDYVWIINADTTATTIENNCCPDQLVQLSGTIFTDPCRLDTNDVVQYVTANGPFAPNTYLVYAGFGTAVNPQFVWVVNIDGTITRIAQAHHHTFYTQEAGKAPLNPTGPVTPSNAVYWNDFQIETWDNWRYTWRWDCTQWTLTSTDRALQDIVVVGAGNYTFTDGDDLIYAEGGDTITLPSPELCYPLRVTRDACTQGVVTIIDAGGSDIDNFYPTYILPEGRSAVTLMWVDTFYKIISSHIDDDPTERIVAVVNTPITQIQVTGANWDIDWGDGNNESALDGVILNHNYVPNYTGDIIITVLCGISQITELKVDGIVVT